MKRFSQSASFCFLPSQRAHSGAPLRPCNSWKKQNRHSLDATATKAFHPRTGLPLLSSPVRNSHNALRSHCAHHLICALIIINKLTDSVGIRSCVCVCVWHSETLASPFFPSDHLKHYSLILHRRFRVE